MVSISHLLCGAWLGIAGTVTATPWPHPRSFNAPQVATPIDVDGDVYKAIWEEVPWSEPFVNIQGPDAPKESGPFKNTATRMKMRWDDKYLYIATEMMADGWRIDADFIDRNEPIYQKDSDIEVFLDTDGSNVNYKELEVNAKNTVWNLMLDKPYSSGGTEQSGRVAKPDEPNYWDVYGQKTATKMYGDIGKMNKHGKWTAEIALSHSDSLSRTQGSSPGIGKFWRINFSRVERKGKYNWVWSPMMLWTPEKRKYEGKINMHAPDAWGYVHFVEAGAASAGPTRWVDPAWPVKSAGSQIFYAQQFAQSEEGGGHLQFLPELRKNRLINESLFVGLQANIRNASTGWTASVSDATGCALTVIGNSHAFDMQCGEVAGLITRLLSPGRCLGITFASLILLGIAGAVWVQQQKVELKPSD
mmetsp:Transcript_165702/g.318134  ORF Transcript_165702/g.318134 Transcript_165702/m.318134 type:complete len:417 (-) Transcript_165702:37-1287(-)